MRSLIQLYALAVCFATLMCFVVALGIGLYDLLEMASPQFTSPYVDAYQSNDAFVQYYPDKKDLPEDELTRLRQQRLGEALRAQRRTAMQSGAFVLIIVAIDLVVFALHWRIARREGNGAELNATA